MNRTHSTRTRIGLILLALLILPWLGSARAATNTIGGNAASLDSANWSTTLFPMENVVTLTAGATGNGPLTLSHTAVANTNYTFGVFFEYTAESFALSTIPAGEELSTITWSASVQSPTGVALFPALMQGGQVYKMVGDHNVDYNVGATVQDISVNFSGASSWAQVNPAAVGSTTLDLASNPDFSTGGSALTFGVLHWWGSTSGSYNGTQTANYSAFQVDVATAVHQNTIVAFGDSTTAPRDVSTALSGRPAGASTEGLNSADSANVPHNIVNTINGVTGDLYVYSDRLRDSLAAQAYPVEAVDNEGVGSNRTDLAIARLDSDVRAKNPDIVIIQYGINDSAHDAGPGTESRVALDATEMLTHSLPARGNFEDNLTSIVQTLKADGADVILMTPNRITDYSAVTEARLGLYADVVRQIAADESVALLDVWSLYTDYDAVGGQSYTDLLLDGVHPNGDGHALLATALEPIVTSMIPEPATMGILSFGAVGLIRRRRAR